ncbi:serine/threonine-protein kinase [Streptomyces sp. LMG1-1-1.1]|uniref:serine/threonine-protein kinase n=1 Tax=Streptomyces sp. LMG1-1-1.1 TaxID=3135245 RepID=UPI0034672FE6
MTRLPAQIGRYAVERELGTGGMGQVYLAYSPGGDPVAVKVIRNDRLDQATRARFEKEALIARTVVGTNRVARFLDADPYADQPWMAVEYVPGRTLHEHVRDKGTLPVPLVASLGALLAEGLEAVHRVGLLHRDLKPQNVMLGEYGPILIDFGLGAFVDTDRDNLTLAGMIIGTVRCMPPEQALARVKPQEPADVYGLGTVLLYAATCHYPYEGADWLGIATQVADEEQPPDLGGLPDALLPLIESMLAYAPADRPSLAEVTRQCVALVREAKLSAAQARHALITATVSSGGGARGAGHDGPSSSVWERIEQFASPIGEASDADEDGQDSPLDRILPILDDSSDETPTEPPADVVREAADRPGTEPPAEKPKRGRKPASLVVSEDLRQRYAMQSAL